MSDEVLVCKVGDQNYYGTALEATAARLEPGQEVMFRGNVEVVKSTWFYDGIIVSLESGKTIYPSLGDVFEVKLEA